MQRVIVGFFVELLQNCLFRRSFLWRLLLASSFHLMNLIVNEKMCYGNLIIVFNTAMQRPAFEQIIYVLLLTLHSDLNGVD